MKLNVLLRKIERPLSFYSLLKINRDENKNFVFIKLNFRK